MRINLVSKFQFLRESLSCRQPINISTSAFSTHYFYVKYSRASKACVYVRTRQKDTACFGISVVIDPSPHQIKGDPVFHVSQSANHCSLFSKLGEGWGLNTMLELEFLRQN